MIDRDRLHHIMRVRGLCAIDVCEKLGITRLDWWARMVGRVRWKREELELLADILDCPVGYLRGTLDEEELRKIAHKAGRNDELVEQWIGPDLTGWDIVHYYEKPRGTRPWKP